jgi:putative nucleotidyltransferase with HDIG domain
MSELETKDNRRRNYLLSVRNLPSIPSVTKHVLDLLDDPMTSTNDISNLINKDQALVARVLTVANSPLYGLPRKVPSIEFAILILGFNQIRQIVLALSMFDTFKNEDSEYWNRREFWEHSFMTAMAAKAIADDLGYAKTSEAFTAGLLHDLGIVVTQKYFNKDFVKICDSVTNKEVSYEFAEQHIMNLTHQEIGKILCDRWHLPVNLGQAIFFHHNPSNNDENLMLSAIVHLADYTTNTLGCGSFRWDADIKLDEKIIPILDLGSREYVDNFIESYREHLEEQLGSLPF